MQQIMIDRCVNVLLMLRKSKRIEMLCSRKLRKLSHSMNNGQTNILRLLTTKCKAQILFIKNQYLKNS